MEATSDEEHEEYEEHEEHTALEALEAREAHENEECSASKGAPKPDLSETPEVSMVPLSIDLVRSSVEAPIKSPELPYTKNNEEMWNVFRLRRFLRKEFGHDPNDPFVVAAAVHIIKDQRAMLAEMGIEYLGLGFVDKSPLWFRRQITTLHDVGNED